MSKVAPLSVAVIGLGYFAQLHLAAWAAQGGAKLVAVSDLDPEKTESAARAYGCEGFADSNALLSTSDPDIIDIVAPPPAHADLIRAALKPGRVIICQKPFCTSLAEAEAITAEAEAANTTLLIHENFRFQPWYRTIKELLDSGQMGQVYQARFTLRPGDGRGPDAYMLRQPAFQTMPRLLIHETGVHFVDLFRWLFGEIDSIYADLRQLNPALAGEDAGMMLLTHKTGIRSLFDGNRLSDHVADNPRNTMGEMAIEGEAGTLTLNGAGEVGFRRFGSAHSEPVRITHPIDTTTFGGGCVAALIAHVVAATTGRGRFENQAADYLAVIRACDAAYQSDAQNCAVSISSNES